MFVIKLITRVEISFNRNEKGNSGKYFHEKSLFIVAHFVFQSDYSRLSLVSLHYLYIFDAEVLIPEKKIST